MGKTNNRVWLASHADSEFGVNTRAFSTKAKAQAWMAELEADGNEFDSSEDGEGPYFQIKSVRIDSRDSIEEG